MSLTSLQSFEDLQAPKADTAERPPTPGKAQVQHLRPEPEVPLGALPVPAIAVGVDRVVVGANALLTQAARRGESEVLGLQLDRLVRGLPLGEDWNEPAFGVGGPVDVVLTHADGRDTRLRARWAHTSRAEGRLTVVSFERPSGNARPNVHRQPLGPAPARTSAPAIDPSKLDQLQRQIDQQHIFFAQVIHDVKNPVTAVLHGVALARESLADGELNELERDLCVLEEGARSLLELVRRTLDVQKIQAGEMSVQLEPVDITTVALQVVGEMQGVAAKSENRITLDCRPYPGKAFADAIRVRQVLENLVGNACRFTENGTVSVIARRRKTGADGDRVDLTVSDTGLGMSKSQVGQLFQDYVQVSDDPKRRAGGSGLGLAISRRLARMMGGEISVTSTPGEGTAFTLSLPGC